MTEKSEDLRISAIIVREMLYQSGYSSEDLGVILGVSRQQINTYMNHGVIKIKTLLEISNATGISLPKAKKSLNIENWL